MKKFDATATGAYIKALCKRDGISVTKLAEMLNVSPVAVYKWVWGENFPSIDLLVELSNLFQVSFNDLIKTKETA